MKTIATAGLLVVLSGAVAGIAIGQVPGGGLFPGSGLPPVVGPGGLGGAGPPGGSPVPRGRGPAGGSGGPTRGFPVAKAKQDQQPERHLSWELWWELNDDRFQRQRVLSRMSDTTSEDSDAVLGSSGKNVVAKVGESELAKDIIPALRLATKDAFVGARRQATIALGKVSDAGRNDVYLTIRALVADQDWEVRSAASMAMGLQGAAEGVPLLVMIMKNDPAGRKYCGVGGHDLSPRERGFAALGIGLVGMEAGLDAEPVQQLLAVLRENTPHHDVRVFPALALGIMRAYAAVPDLRKIAFDAAAPEVVRAHAIVALAKLGDRGAVPLLVREGLVDRSAHVQRSSAIGLGLLVEKDDARTVGNLIEQAKSSSDRAVRNFALIALGQIGHRAGVEYLIHQLKRGNQHDRTFGAIALGIHGFKNPEGRKELGRELLAAFTDARSETERAAFAIALSLADYKPGMEPVRVALQNTGSPELKAHLATAVGLFGDRGAIPVLAGVIQRAADPVLIMKAAIALGSIGDPSAVKLLVKVFEDAGNNQPALLGATLALGFIGDRSAVPSLVKALDRRDSSHDYARAYSAMALGILGDKREHRALSVVQENVNYLATTEWLPELLTLY